MRQDRRVEGTAPVGAGFLSGYRVLELAGQESLFAGKLLADMGAEVIKVEPPGGDPARLLGPMAPGVDPVEASLLWQALNTGKKSVILDLETYKGRDLFLELAATADVVIEAYPPGHLEAMGLGYEDLCRARPELVMASITAFGEDGPYRDFVASDLVIWALSGLLYICGDTDRPPVRISLPQSWLHAGADAATGAAMALFHRGRTGQGQRVVVSALKGLERVAYASHILWDARGRVLRRQGSALRIPPMGTTTPLIWPCADGFVAFYLFGGQMGAVSNPALTKWMDDEGMGSEYMKGMDWPRLDLGRTPQEEADKGIVEPVAAFFAGHTQRQLWDEGVKRRVMVYPVNDASGVLAEAQLKERGFWVRLAHPAFEQELTLPGPFVKTEDGLCLVRGAAPTLGQHNQEVLASLGLEGGR
ncbi:MAG: CoA transferase [Proteobacteria bacterium]|nr:CoA transferase [Pseudomonadota bacterium]MBU4278012.1 CoA transferase [Pseudomonadota bacterium]MBU4381404.1 CoA transferase [Pseudomonadota bacterium]MCG2764886.1 CoA transferase [Desulfarculaceae bacterium]